MCRLVTEDKDCVVINTLKDEKAADPDGFCTEFYKNKKKEPPCSQSTL